MDIHVTQTRDPLALAVDALVILGITDLYLPSFSAHPSSVKQDRGGGHCSDFIYTGFTKNMVCRHAMGYFQIAKSCYHRLQSSILP